MVVVIQTGVTSQAQRGLPIHKIPGQTAVPVSVFEYVPIYVRSLTGW